MAERFARPTFHKGLAPALLKMYRELMTPGLFPFAQAKMQKKRAAEDEDPEEAGGEDIEEEEALADMSEGEVRGGTDGEKINDESFPQDEQFDYDEQPQHFDDDGANGFPEEDGVRRRESYLSEDEHDPSQPALEEDDEAQLEDCEHGAKSERKKKMHRHQMHFLRLFGRNFEKCERPTFQKIVPKAAGAREAALLFHELLAAKTKDLIEVEQDEPYGAIYVTKVKKNFDRAVADMQPVA
jgi:chromatin segregation and condensation protein Rec8/ScpA/Scc1 (kleisin family)